MVILLLCLCGCSDIDNWNRTGTESSSTEEGIRFTNQAEIVNNIRSGIRQHSQKITITFSGHEDILDKLPDTVAVWMEEAMEETDRADEGDYIRYQTGGYEQNCSYEQQAGTFSYTVTILPKYYLYLTQEEQVRDAIDGVFLQLGVYEDLSDYEKIRRIYDYLCRNVTYDRVHKKNPYYYLRSTAYAALLQKTATCQGYSVALYRLLKEAGIPVRIITGSSSGDTLHAWNIVKLDGAWYYLDATWDSAYPEAGYQYFLKGSDAFPDHIADPMFLTEQFQADYPVSGSDYQINEKKA